MTVRDIHDYRDANCESNQREKREEKENGQIK